MPIYTGGFLWVDSTTPHRRNRIALIAATESPHVVSGPVPSVREIAEACFEAHASLRKHLLCVATVFEQQFGPDLYAQGSQYRRRSGARISVMDRPTALARASGLGAMGTVEVSTGLLYALEDIWQCVVSDNHTDLHAYGGVEMSSRNHVMRSVETFHAHDRLRFYDYSFVMDRSASLLEQAKDGTTVAWLDAAIDLTTSSIKMLSLDPQRVAMGDLMADLSLQWILGHEDAHIYSGHAEYFQKALGISADELEDADDEFLEAARRASTNTPRLRHLRAISELHADEQACYRLVDTLLDDRLFLVYPMLEFGVQQLVQRAASEGRSLPERQARFVVVARLCISAAVGAAMMFHRNVEKKDIAVVDYPDIGVRIANIIVATLMRTNLSLRASVRHRAEFEQPDMHARTCITAGVSWDIKVLTWNLLSHQALLKDPDLEGKRIQFESILKTIDSESNTLELVLAAGGFSVDVATSALAAVSWITKSSALRGLLERQLEFPTEFRDAYLPLQLERNAHIPHKHHESIDRMQRRAEDLRKLLDLADLERGRT